MRIPVWVALAVATFVLFFGAYRIRLGLTMSAEAEAAAKQRGGLYGMGKRFHLFIGIVYIVMGVMLTLMAFGVWQPLGNQVGPDTAVPSKDKAPTRNTIPIDQLPQKK